MGRFITLIAFTLLGLGGGFLIGQSFQGDSAVDAEIIDKDVPIQTVLAEGKIKPAGGIRFVTTLPGRKVSRLNVEVGTKVQANQTRLCQMADEQLLEMQWQLTEAKKSDLNTEVEQKIFAAELNLVTAEASLKEAQLNRMRLSTDSAETSYVDKKIEASLKKLNRLKELSEAEATAAFVSTQDIFEQELDLEKAIAEKESLKRAADLAVETAENALGIAKKAYENASEAKQGSESLSIAAAIAEKQYRDAMILAPIDGEVVRIHVKEKDNVGNLPIMEIADLSNMIVEAEVYFANLKEVEKGQTVRISSPALTQDLIGKVVSKSNYIGGGLLQSANPLAMANQETAKVLIAIDPEFTSVARSFLNLQVTVDINTK